LEKTDKDDPIVNYDKSLFKSIVNPNFKYNCGFAISKFIIKKTREKGFDYKWCFVISWSISVIRSLIPIISHVYDDNAIDLQLVDIFLIILVTILNNLYFAKNFQFILFCIYELYRQCEYLSQLSNMICSKKNNKYHTRKYYPTINLFDDFSLKSWKKMHQLFRHYGEKIKLRIEAYLTIFSIFYIIVITFLVTSFLFNRHFISILSFQVLCYEVSFMLICILMVLKKGIAINEHFSIHLVLLRNNREILFDLMKFGEIYFDKSKFIPENLIYLKGVEIVKANIEDKLNYFKNLKGYLIKNNFALKLRNEILKDLLKTTDEVIEQLKFEANSHPFSILGIALTDNVLTSILAIFGSICFALFKKVISDTA